MPDVEDIAAVMPRRRILLPEPKLARFSDDIAFGSLMERPWHRPYTTMLSALALRQPFPESCGLL